MPATGQISIAPLTPDDRGSWQRLWSGYLAFYGATLPGSVFEVTWTRLLSGGAGEFRGLIARNEAGEAVGIAHFLRHRHCWHEADTIYLQDLFVDEQARGQGVARALIAQIYAIADESGAANVYWLTQESNAAARRLYDQVGVKTEFIKYARH
ncbi:MAG: GNAT family N-acetyltransferase [Neomegalonema sp.]|nr:GNAT family N-acetyltransferase [Neomegalonema sp.]